MLNNIASCHVFKKKYVLQKIHLSILLNKFGKGSRTTNPWKIKANTWENMKANNIGYKVITGHSAITFCNCTNPWSLMFGKLEWLSWTVLMLQLLTACYKFGHQQSATLSVRFIFHLCYNPLFCTSFSKIETWFYLIVALDCCKSFIIEHDDYCYNLK